VLRGFDAVLGPRQLPAALRVFEPERYPHSNELGAVLTLPFKKTPFPQ
jgi:hypothetical protein